ncbi:ABC transporter ATP-binding protein [uncultured Sulfitobacter sp.]|uniref:ABC transporter ATP-binding protein n=1 Tax=uncultured Sulfitobacter sp. TaxID=191468 RepID=UPI00261FFB04|nr:ABC transporter ATP-binding protein [uncultured Sulfitobacter sp.]
MDSIEPILSIRGLDAFYGGSRIIQNASLSIRPGEKVALLGRNGAGKSTLMKSLLNAGPRVVGDIHFDGKDISALATDARSRMGLVLVPEDRRIYSNITVAENIELGRHAARAGAAVSSDEVYDLFPLLAPLRQRAGYQLSGGQQQIVAVARGLMGAPRLLLLDEPVEGLAPVVVDEMVQHIARICETRELALLIAEQNLSFARRCTDRVVLIDSGRIVFDETWEVFDANPELKERHLAV